MSEAQTYHVTDPRYWVTLLPVYNKLGTRSTVTCVTMTYQRVRDGITHEYDIVPIRLLERPLECWNATQATVPFAGIFDPSKLYYIMAVDLGDFAPDDITNIPDNITNITPSAEKKFVLNNVLDVINLQPYEVQTCE